MDDNFYPKITNYGYFYSVMELFTDKNSEYKKIFIYMAPEILHYIEFTKMSDVYLFGVILYMIITSNITITNIDNDFISKRRKGYRPPLDGISQPYRDLIEKCWSQNQNERPTFDEIVEKLKNDQGFITEKVDINEYQNYIKFIEVDYYSECKESQKEKSFILRPSYFSSFDFVYQIIEKIPEMQYKIGKYYIEGLEGLKQNIEFGMI